MRFQNASELRWLFAFIVLINHAIQLGEFHNYKWLQQILSSEMAVYGFFILSGYLIIGSLERSVSLKQYYLRRIFRIYPGYILSIFFFLSIIISGRLNTGTPSCGGEVLKYLAANLTFLNFFHPRLEGVFCQNAFKEVNGALWSIKIELMFYILAPCLVIFARVFSYIHIAIFMFLVGLSWPPFIFYLFGKNSSLIQTLSYQLPGQLVYFGIGVLFYQFVKEKYNVVWYFLTFVVISVIIWVIRGSKEGIGVFCLLTIIGTAGKMPQFGHFAEKNDLSYGIYLCHFPIIQVLISNQVHTLRFPLFITIAATLTCVYCWVSWRFVEAPAIAFIKRIKI